MLFGFGRVPGCLGLGALFLWDEWRDERTVCQRGGLSVLVFGSVRCGGLTGGWWAISAALDGCRG